jgi:hypothetical protein
LDSQLSHLLLLLCLQMRSLWRAWDVSKHGERAIANVFLVLTTSQPVAAAAAAAAAVLADEELMAGLDVSKHGERAIAIDDVLKVHVEALNNSKHGNPQVNVAAQNM